MPTYVVKTINNRNLVIEADSFFRNRDNVYMFDDENGDTVAEVPRENIFAVVETDAEQEDFYFVDDANDPGPEDETLECGAPVSLLDNIPLLAEFLDCPLVQEALDEAGRCVCLCDNDPDFVPEETNKLDHRIYYGNPEWGITFKGIFYPFGTKEAAENSLSCNMEDGYEGRPVSEFALVEESNGE